MNYDLFIRNWLGKPIDYDGFYGPQCVDEICQYLADNGKAHCIAWANAKDWANAGSMLSDFIWTDNNPSDFSQVPNRGDIVVWSGDLPGSEGCGHIAIFDMVVSAGVFQSLDQNWGGQYVHFIPNHNWDYILGWFTPKTIPVAPDPAPAPEPAPDPAPVPAPTITVTPPPSPDKPPVVTVTPNDPPKPTGQGSVQKANIFEIILNWLKSFFKRKG